MKDLERFYFPAEIVDDLGLPKNYINALKRRGCPFVGKKTSILWVRAFLAKEAGAIPLLRELGERPPHSAASKSSEPAFANG